MGGQLSVKRTAVYIAAVICVGVSTGTNRSVLNIRKGNINYKSLLLSC